MDTSGAEVLRGVLWFAGTVLLNVAPFILLFLLYFFLTRPLQRKERTRLLLHVIDLGTSSGSSAERAIMAAAASADPMLGRRFYDVAAEIESGLRLDQALAKVPRIVPPEIAGMLRAGCEMSDVCRVLPACRQWLNDAVSQTRGALNYLPILAFIILPLLPAFSTMIVVSVLPKFEQIAQDMGGSMPPFTRAVFSSSGVLIVVPIVFMLVFQALIFFYCAGPRGREMARVIGLGGVSDRLLWTLPWRRNRMKRDFTTMLALLLDAGVTEQRAVTLAAESTANRVFRERAELVAAKLAAGSPLTDALAVFDDRAELKWRISTAAHSRDGFFSALRGWLQFLEAKAFQQEQAAAQVLTTSFVLINGVLVGIFLIAVFLMLIAITEEAPLW